MAFEGPNSAAKVAQLPVAAPGTPGGLAGPLDESADLPTAQVPAVAIGDAYEVADLAARLALSATKGDLTAQADTGRNYLLNAEPASVEGNWVQLQIPPTASVTDGGAGNAAKTFILDANGKADGRDLGADGAALDSHVGSTANPHSVTAAQAGAAPAAQGVTNGDSHDHSGGDGATIPVSTGLSGTSAGQVQFGSSGALGGDATLIWDNTDKRLGVGASPTHHLHVVVPADDDVFIDAETTPNTQPDGSLHVHHKAGADGTRALGIRTDINSRPDTPSIQITQILTGLAATEDTGVIDIDVDTSTATGGIVEAVRVTKSGSGTASVQAFHAGPGTIAVHQDSAAFGAVDTAFTYDGAFTDVTAAFNATGTDVTLFAANGDMVYIGADAVFGEIDWDLATPSTGAGIRPIFEYWSGAAWSTFGPLDETNGFRQNGVMSWQPTNLAGWALTTVNGANKFWVRITRNTPAAITAPIENLVQVAAATEYVWGENGDVNIRRLTLGTTTEVQAIYDTDAMTEDSNVALATQQSIKAYVDSRSYDIEVYDFTSSTGFTTTNNNGTAAITGGVAQLDAPNATNIKLYQANFNAPIITRQWTKSPSVWSCCVRLVSLTNESATVNMGLAISDSAGAVIASEYVIAIYRGADRVLWENTGPLTTIVDTTTGFAWGGNEWIGFEVCGMAVRAAIGTGTTSRTPTTWTYLGNKVADATTLFTGSGVLTYVKLFMRKNNVNTVSAVTGIMDDLIIREGPLPRALNV